MKRLKLKTPVNLLCLIVMAAGYSLPAAQDSDRTLRVCSDPNNLPYSNRAEEGFENKLAELVADKMDAELSYTWWPQRRGFIRNTLDAGRCDLIMGVPAHYDRVATTKPYYQSSYVFVYRKTSDLDLSSITDPRLRKLRIGVHLTGSDGVNPPPAHALGQQGIVDNVKGYMIYGDYEEPHPASQIIEDVAKKELDVAAVWGPIGGYFAARKPEKMEVSSITDTSAFDSMDFEFPIAIGVRKGDEALRDHIDRILQQNRSEIHSLLREYDVPLTQSG